MRRDRENTLYFARMIIITSVTLKKTERGVRLKDTFSLSEIL